MYLIYFFNIILMNTNKEIFKNKIKQEYKNFKTLINNEYNIHKYNLSYEKYYIFYIYYFEFKDKINILLKSYGSSKVEIIEIVDKYLNKANEYIKNVIGE